MVFDLSGFKVDLDENRQTMIITPDGIHFKSRPLILDWPFILPFCPGALFWLTPDSDVWQNHSNLVLSMNSGSAGIQVLYSTINQLNCFIC